MPTIQTVSFGSKEEHTRCGQSVLGLESSNWEHHILSKRSKARPSRPQLVSMSILCSASNTRFLPTLHVSSFKHSQAGAALSEQHPPEKGIAAQVCSCSCSCRSHAYALLSYVLKAYTHEHTQKTYSQRCTHTHTHTRTTHTSTHMYTH